MSLHFAVLLKLPYMIARKSQLELSAQPSAQLLPRALPTVSTKHSDVRTVSAMCCKVLPVTVPCSWDAPSQAHITFQAQRTVFRIASTLRMLLHSECSPLQLHLYSFMFSIWKLFFLHAVFFYGYSKILGSYDLYISSACQTASEFLSCVIMGNVLGNLWSLDVWHSPTTHPGLEFQIYLLLPARCRDF